MLFDAMNEKSRIVEVYDKVVTYKFEDGQAYRVTENGTLISINHTTAMLEIEQYKERDGRHYKRDLEIGGSFSLKMAPRTLGLYIIGVTFLLALYLLLTGSLV